MVRELLRRQTHTGGDIRPTGLLGVPMRWPRNHIEPSWWSWREVAGFQLQHAEHINTLELRSDLLQVRWRLKVTANVGTRGLHLMDSQVCLGALGHGRSPSASLAPVLERINALCVAGCMVQLLGYCRTETNPADAASRRSAP